jgi:hypothetical protein
MDVKGNIQLFRPSGDEVIEVDDDIVITELSRGVTLT